MDNVDLDDVVLADDKSTGENSIDQLGESSATINNSQDIDPQENLVQVEISLPDNCANDSAAVPDEANNADALTVLLPEQPQQDAAEDDAEEELMDKSSSLDAVGASASARRKKKNSTPSRSSEQLADKDADAAAATLNESETQVGRYQTHRAAAMVAKTKLNSRPPRPSAQDGEEAAAAGAVQNTDADDEVATGGTSGGAQEKPSAVEEAQPASTTAAAEAVNWVMCDRCTKWRSIASHVQQASLPEQWFCHMNSWDARYNNCEAPDEALASSAKQGKAAGGGNKDDLPRSGRGSRGGGRWRQSRLNKDNQAAGDDSGRRCRWLP